MKKHLLLPLLALSCGAAGFVFRLFQNRTGFEAATGLPVPGNLWGILLVALLAAGLFLAVLLSRSLSAGTQPEPQTFHAAFSSRSMIPLSLLVAGIFLVILSGLLEILAGAGLLSSLQAYNAPVQIAPVSGSASRKLLLILGSLSTVSGSSLLLVVPVCRRCGSRELNASARFVADSPLLIPPLLLIIRLVATYRQVSVIPSLETYYVEILTLSALTLAFYLLSSFAFQAGNTRSFTVCAVCAIMLCMTALADQSALCGMMLYAGFAITLLGFLLLRLNNAAPARTH